MNGLNLSNIQDAKLGGTQVSAIYFGNINIWEKDPWISEYFCIECKSAGEYALEVKGTLSDFSIQMSSNKTSWSTYTFDSNNKKYIFNVSAGTKAYIKGTNSAYATSGSNYFNINFTSGSFNVSGNIMSLIYGDNFKGQTSLSTNYTFNSLFKSAGHLVSAGDLRLPATSVKRYAYQNMFNGCTNLTDIPPVIPATYVDYYGCSSMFQGCTSLNKVPDMSKITGVNGYAFANMFAGCTSLTILPDFHNVNRIDYWAPWRYTFNGCTSIVDARWNVNGTRLLPDSLTVTSGGSAYELMFYNCTGLIYAPELTETTPHTGEYNNMFKFCTNASFTAIYTHATSLGSNYFSDILNGAAHTGTVYKASDVTWDSSSYSQFNYNGSGSTAQRWSVSTGNYTSGDYQT